MKTSGGYVLHRFGLVRSAICPHTASLDKPISDTAMQAVNAIQATPWRINNRVLDVVLTAADRRMKIGKLDFTEAPKMPEKVPDADWQVMEEGDKKSHISHLRELHAVRASRTGRLQAINDKLTCAETLRDRPAIWFPHTMDFRGRIYPMPAAGPHPQGDDLGKSLIEFAHGMALGETGEMWLCVRAANAAGKDKLSIMDRIAWTYANSANIQNTADDPFDPDIVGWWTQLDEPWQFLATCYELDDAWSSADIAQYVSHLPVAMDGTCNGLQHLSAMGLDPVGAAAVNLTSSPDRKDIYEEVAAKVREYVRDDAASGKEAALAWVGKVTRSVVKRAVMTTPYGVTDGGIRTQLIEDGHVPVEGDGRGAAADYLRDCLVKALSETVVSAKEIMGWLQATAKTLADGGEAFDWTTPHGCRIRQEYLNVAERRVKTLVGVLQFREPIQGGMVNLRKQSAGSAPNYVHSFDAAHLALTVVAGEDDGIHSWAMIHDSFGTHAGMTTRLARILREVFVEIYQRDWLRALYEELCERYPHLEFMPPPARGDFVVSDVLNSEFFFS